MSSSTCTTDLTNIQLTVPTVPCSNPTDLTAWQQFIDDFNTFITDPNFIKVLQQCLCLNAAPCSVVTGSTPSACPNLVNQPLSIYTNSTCMGCIFSGPQCSKYKDDMSKMTCIITITQQILNQQQPNTVSSASDTLANILNQCCGTTLTGGDIQNTVAQSILNKIAVLGIDSGPPPQSSPPSFFSVKNIWLWIIIGIVTIIIVLIIIRLMVKKGGLSRVINSSGT